eukprot:78376-Amphidinium_carterae.1
MAGGLTLWCGVACRRWFFGARDCNPIAGRKANRATSADVDGYGCTCAGPIRGTRVLWLRGSRGACLVKYKNECRNKRNQNHLQQHQQHHCQ